MAKTRRRPMPQSPYESDSARAALVRDEKLYEVELQGKTVLVGEMWVPLSQMHVDPSYQRPINEARAQRIAAAFSWALAGLVTVSARSKDEYAILDGQMRTRSLHILREPQAWCEVFYDLTPEQEAYIFDIRNGQRVAVSMADAFRAKLAYHEPQADRIRATLEAVGMRIGKDSKDPRCIQAISAVRTLDSWGVLEATVALIRRTWPDHLRAKERGVLLGVGCVVANFNGKVDHERFKSQLEAAPFVKMISDSKSARAIMGGSEFMHFARAVVDAYDHGHKGAGRLGSETLRSPESGGGTAHGR